MYRFLLTRRWLAFALLVVLIALICLRAGIWQMNKLEARKQENAIARANLVADPVDLNDVVRKGGKVTAEAEWTTVRVVGTYDPAHELTVKFTTRNSAPGVDVVTPLALDDGTEILIDRGWMQTLNNNERPEITDRPPPGRVAVVGWLRQNNGADDSAVRPVDGQVRAISSTAIGKELSLPLRDGYLDLQEQSGGTGSLERAPLPDLGQGPHFFYAIQWWFFGLLAIVGYFWFAWTEAHPDRKKPRKPKQRLSDTPGSKPGAPRSGSNQTHSTSTGSRG